MDIKYIVAGLFFWIMSMIIALMVGFTIGVDVEQSRNGKE